MNPIRVIDLFAGPGGLGEGFSSVVDRDHQPIFELELSIEKDPAAHRTLELRSFYRQFESGDAPDYYYRYLRGEIGREQLFRSFPDEARTAARIAWNATLGREPGGESIAVVRDRVDESLGGNGETWVLIGGPPCQAYSVIGRVKLRSVLGDKFEQDRRHTLYKEYLRILADHAPDIFVMENVRGLLSSTLNGSDTFELIKSDLEDPASAVPDARTTAKYRIFSLARPSAPTSAEPEELVASDFLVRFEDYGVPQRRHRLILIGVREDLIHRNHVDLFMLGEQPFDRPNVGDAINGLQPLRSNITKEPDSDEGWLGLIREFCSEVVDELSDQRLIDALTRVPGSLEIPAAGVGAEFVPGPVSVGFAREWFLDSRLGGSVNHSTRGHMRGDLQRYLFASVFSQVHGFSPVLADFPVALLPRHRNVRPGRRVQAFADRFRVQVAGLPGTTVTSHIFKDGHYYIHPDPAQCRSLTVREAARIQTFPDNYFFEGPRSAQYAQVGNAVPPLAALQVAIRVAEMLGRPVEVS